MKPRKHVVFCLTGIFEVRYTVVDLNTNESSGEHIWDKYAEYNLPNNGVDFVFDEKALEEFKSDIRSAYHDCEVAFTPIYFDY